MKLLALDIGSSSVKAALMAGGNVVGRFARANFDTTYAAGRAEVKADAIMAAVVSAIRRLGTGAKTVDLIAATVMGPSWLAMDAKGRAITPVVTHQDRRSVEMAGEIERRVGKARHLKLAGNRPFPGGISSTTTAWFAKHDARHFKRAAKIGHFNTFLLHRLTGMWLTDPSQASFTGLYRTTTLGGWSDELCDAIGVSSDQLPDVREANQVAGQLTPLAASQLGLRAGTPVLVGCMDTSAAMLAIGAKPGQLLNVCGSTDVLAVCTSKPHPHERLLTRGLGVGKKWMSVSTLAAAGSALAWAHRTISPDWPEAAMYAAMRKRSKSSVRFEPYLAGERTSIEQREGAFTGLSLSTTREELLSAVGDAIARASAERLPLLREVTKLGRSVVITGGVADGLADLLHRDWGSGWRFRHRSELTTQGLAALAAMAH